MRALDHVERSAAPPALRLLRHRWTAAILVELSAAAPIGYLALHRRLPGVAQKVLTQHLRYLCSAGALHRREDPISRRVQYELSAHGRQLAELVGPLYSWPTPDARDAIAVDGLIAELSLPI